MCIDEFEGELYEFDWDNDISLEKIYGLEEERAIANIINNKNLYNDISSNVIKCFDDLKYPLYRDYFKIYNCDYSGMSSKEMKDIKEKFLKYYDESWYEAILSNINDSLVYSGHMEEYDGCAFGYPSLEKNFVFTSNRYGNNLLSCCNSIHEYGHVFEFDLIYRAKLGYNFNKIVHTPFCEVSSCFFEYAFLMYLKENKLYEKDVNLYLQKYYIDLLKFNSNIYMFTKMNDNDFKNDVSIDSKLIDELNSIQHILNFYELLSEDDIKINVYDEFIYGFGLLFSIYLYESYVQDKETFKKEFKNSLLNYPIVKDISAFNNVGLSKDEICKGDILRKVLKKHINN